MTFIKLNSALVLVFYLFSTAQYLCHSVVQFSPVDLKVRRINMQLHTCLFACPVKVLLFTQIGGVYYLKLHMRIKLNPLIIKRLGLVLKQLSPHGVLTI